MTYILDNETKRRYAETRNARRRERYHKDKNYRKKVIDRTLESANNKRIEEGEVTFISTPFRALTSQEGVAVHTFRAALKISNHSWRCLLKQSPSFKSALKVSVKDGHEYMPTALAKILYHACQEIYMRYKKIKPTHPALSALYSAAEKYDTKGQGDSR